MSSQNNVYTTDAADPYATPTIQPMFPDTDLQRQPNDTGQDSSGHAELRLHVATLVVCTVANVFIVLLSCYGNGKILVKCHQNVKHSSSSFVLLKANLSIADFLLSLTQCPVLMFLFFGMPVLVDVLLPIAVFTAGLTLTVSLCSLTGIALLRCLKLRRSCNFTKKSSLVLVTVTWILGTATGSVLSSLVATHLDIIDTQHPATILDNPTLHIIVYIVVSMFLITTVVVVFSYTTLAVALYAGPTVKPCLPKFRQTTMQGSDTIQLSASENCANKNKAIASCAVIVVTHLITWIPFVVVFSFDYCMSDVGVSLNLKVVAWMLVLCQSALNPFLYEVPKDPAKTYLKFYCEQCLLFPDCKLHSNNPAGIQQLETKSCESSNNNNNLRHLPSMTGIFHIRMLEHHHQCDGTLEHDAATKECDQEEEIKHTP